MPGSGFEDFGFRVCKDPGFRISGLGFRVENVRSGAGIYRFRVLGREVQASVKHKTSRVSGFPMLSYVFPSRWVC